jgi:hypothetical protein
LFSSLGDKVFEEFPPHKVLAWWLTSSVNKCVLMGLIALVFACPYV